MNAIDLHVHSNKSDGSSTPEELVQIAARKGLSYFALTDHDTVAGIDAALAYAESLRHADAALTCNANGHADTALTCSTNSHANDALTYTESHHIGTADIPSVIPGIELSTEYKGKDIHLVGLYIDHKAPAFLSYLNQFVASRENRNRKMCQLLADSGIDISYEQLLEAFPDSVLTRAHYAVYLVKHGYCLSKEDAFQKYLGDHTKYFVPREKITPEMGIELILKAGGVPILAHPILYHLSAAELDTLVARLKNAGLIGIEAIYATYSQAEERQIRNLAAKYDLCISGGSDYHGEAKPGLELGTGYGKLFVPESLLDKLKPRA